MSVREKREWTWMLEHELPNPVALNSARALRPSREFDLLIGNLDSAKPRV